MTTIDVLVCNLDGSQHLEQMEVTDDFFAPTPDPTPSLEEQVAELTKLVNILAGGEA